jgi:hypothetical protein
MLLLSFGVFSMPPTDFFNTVADGDWNTGTTWDTGTVPPTNQTGGNDDITIDHNVTLTGNLDVKSGTVITINAGDTLTINGDVEFNNGCIFVVNGVLIINGNVTNNNNSDGVTINGTMVIDGDYDGGNGSDLTGTGDMDITGSVTTDGDATVFGSDSDCTSDCDNSADSPLPVELVFFRAEVDESNHVQLEWLTGSEINNDYFELLRSTNNGLTFEPVGTVEGVGNSSTPQFYSFVDTKPSKGYNYYKLIQYDYDGESEEHNMVVVLIEHNYVKDLKIYPNPSPYGDDVNVELIGFKGQEVLIIVMDALGKVYYEKVVLSAEDDTIIVINSNLDMGTYLIVGSEKQELYRRKLIVK